MTLAVSANSQTILQHVDDKKADSSARRSGFDYVKVVIIGQFLLIIRESLKTLWLVMYKF
jgi:hypothetical protein